MTDFQENKPERGNWFWILVIVILFAILIYWFYDPVGEVPVANDEGTAVPTAEYTTAPEGGVPVDLPDVTVTTAPDELQDAAPTPATTPVVPTTPE